MTDINQRVPRAVADIGASAVPVFDRAGTPEVPEAELLELIELLFFAYREFTREPDAILAEFGFGRAHHRVLHFVNRYPGLRVADLLEILKITKQSLGRVLKQLVDEGYVEQRAGEADRRERLLYPTVQGRALADRLVAPQLERIARSLESPAGESAQAVRDFLYRMVSEEDRPSVDALLASAAPRAGGPEEAS